MAGDEKKFGIVGGNCPICGKPTVHGVRPFCSARCADIDLGRWVSGGYLIAGGLADADEDGDEALASGQAAKPAGSPRDEET